MAKSKQARKQRKALYTKPLHARKAELHVHLSDELKAKLATKKRAMLVRKGDKVEVVKGRFAGRSGKVASVNYQDYTLYIEGVTVRNAKGEEKLASVRPQVVVL
ncbi:MAG TPA: 50S ribosomal protein L24, partial [Candidatus Micrarchaeota archaeon]|nr:50S ribosomal protein L24 [Candidatus Micrarchaeota archaeon]